MTKELWKGNEAVAEAAVRAGVEAYFGYPITPQNEILEYMSRRLPELNRVFVQAESELAAINMVYGAAVAGIRVMTSSSSPGISLMMEGMSYIAASLVPCVIVDMMRGGPGLGNILPSQADYAQLVKGGGHGDYHPIVLAPASIQEAVDLTYQAFDLAEKYKTIVIIAGDGSIGQMMEPAAMPPMQPVKRPTHDQALTGAAGRPKRIITSLYLEAGDLEKLNNQIQATLAEIQKNEVRYTTTLLDGAEYVIVGFGTAGRVAQTTVKEARAQGIAVGLFRPISLYPFPYDALRQATRHAKGVLVVEMNAGQMLEDVKLAVLDQAPIAFLGKTGGFIPLPDEILTALQGMIP